LFHAPLRAIRVCLLPVVSLHQLRKELHMLASTSLSVIGTTCAAIVVGIVVEDVPGVGDEARAVIAQQRTPPGELIVDHVADDLLAVRQGGTGDAQGVDAATIAQALHEVGNAIAGYQVVTAEVGYGRL